MKIKDCNRHDLKMIRRGVSMCMKCGYCCRVCWECKVYLIGDRAGGYSATCPKCSTVFEIDNNGMMHKPQPAKLSRDEKPPEIEEPIVEAKLEKKVEGDGSVEFDDPPTKEKDDNEIPENKEPELVEEK